MLSTEPEKLQSELHRQRLDRSPHPYNRQSVDLPDRIYKAGFPPLLKVSSAPEQKQVEYDRSHSSGASSQTRLTTSPSDSGTEADDERPILRALTAPPLRPRKGLRAPGGTLSASPLLTPYLLDDEPDPFVIAEHQRQKVKPDKSEEDDKTEKLQRRRRHIVLRRTLETLILGFVGRVSYRSASQDYLLNLQFQTAVILAVYVLYGIKLLVRRLVIGWDRSRQLGIRIPITKDPAPILYPPTIPIFVALISSSEDSRIVLTNLVLSICSIPRKAIPFQAGHIQWVLSLAPLILHPGARRVIEIEEQTTLLFPLHHTLLPCLEYLTTTSLLSTELQLLTAALVNLLLYANSPQAFIVKALLWIGGLTVFVTCKNVLTWTVSLARIPNWRYRQVKHGIFKRSPILRTLDGLLGGWLSAKIESSIRQSQIGSDDDQPEDLQTPRGPKKGSNGAIARSSSQQRRPSDYSVMVQRSRQRRYTLPTNPSGLSEAFELRRTASIGLQKLRDRPKTFQALTSAQAFLLKWIYAGYTYIIVLTTILVPVRIYIGYNALSGHEPFGWALGYLFGAIPSFRLSTVYWNLDSWIPLPLYDTSGSSLPEPSTIRLLITAHIFGTLVFGLVGVLTLATLAEVDTRRKLFHGMMVTMFLPTILVDPCFVSLALALALAVFLLLDLFRASQLPPLSRPLTLFLAPYVDGRDHRGPVIVSHIFLLVGCAIPLWLELAASPRDGEGALKGWSVPSKGIGLVSGVICVGMGDAAASLIGRRWGRRRWPWGGGKSLEGSAAFAVAVLIGLTLAKLWSWELARLEHKPYTLELTSFLGKSTLAACGASFTEAVLTGANDNVLVPIVLWLLVKGLEI